MKNNNISDNTSIHNSSQKIKTIESFFNVNNNKIENINKYETQNYDEDYSNEIKTKKIDISIEKIIRNIPGINSSNYEYINHNFNNLYEFINSEKEKKFELFGRINGTKIISLFNYEYQYQ